MLTKPKPAARIPRPFMLIAAFCLGVIMALAGFVVGYTAPQRLTAPAVVQPITFTPTATAKVPLANLKRSILDIEATWSGTVTVPTKYGTMVVPVETSSRCTAWFAGYIRGLAFQSTRFPAIVTAGHCLSSENIEGRLLADAFDKVGASADGSSSSWQVTSFDGPVIQIVPTYDLARTLGKINTRLDLVASVEPEKGDRALLTSDSTLKGFVPLAVAPDSPRVGEPVMSIGYPGAISKTSVEGFIEASFKKGSVSSRQISDYGYAVTEVSSPLSAGMSGGPTVDRNGNVIGINSYLTDSQPFNAVTGTDDLRRFLKDNGVETPAASTRILDMDGTLN